jgi:Flp pilus assembly protein TadD
MIAGLLLLLSFQVSPEAAQHINAGMKAKAAGDLDTAIREFRRVAELAPTLAAAHVNLGAAYLARHTITAPRSLLFAVQLISTPA